MSWLPESKEHLPLTWWKGHPIYLSALLALGGVASMILTAILMAVSPGLVAALIFTPENFLKGFVWTPVTYWLVNPADLWLVLSCYFLWNFGEAVERHLGRRSFVRLGIILLLVSPLLVSLLAFFGPARGSMGMSQWGLGIFIAFATLYPRAQISLILFSVEARILAAIYVGVNALQHLAVRDWTGLAILAGLVGTAVAYIRYEQGALTLPKMPAFGRQQRPARSSVKNPPGRSSGDEIQKPAVPVEKKAARPRRSPAVDDILDKISRDGMHSLTAEERKILDRASEDLQRGGGA